jgi:nucleotide-binding universal stress UspA family protein
MTSKVEFHSALEDFRIARRQAALQSIMSRLRGRSDALLSYEDVRKQLRGIEHAERTLTDIPVAAIIGSVNRYTDFTRNFLPKKKVASQRWARVKATAATLMGLPPIEVYQIGEIFFVQDGNHRVSIARQAGDQYIQAYVKTVQTRIPLTADTDADDLIIKSEYVEFLEHTQFDQIFPDSDLSTTSPGHYPFIQQQIEVLHFRLELSQKKSLAFEDAIRYWHNQIYLPIVEVIQEQDLLQNFPERTETDLFLWLIEYQAELARKLGWNITPESAAGALVARFSAGSKKLSTKVHTAIQNWIYGQPTGKWRQEQLANHQGRMFGDILVVFSGHQEEKELLRFAAYLAQLEGSKIFGLCCIPPNQPDQDLKLKQYQKDFDHICEANRVTGNLAFAFDKNPINHIVRRARFADLVIFPTINRNFKPNHISNLIQNCPVPIIGLPAKRAGQPKKVLLAYDGSPKAEEALFLAAYVTKFWELNLVVLSVSGKKTITPEMMFKSYEYLERYGVKAEYIKASGPPAAATIFFAVEEECDLIITGGYGVNTFKKLFTGSLVDEVLAQSGKPVLVCR